MYVKIRYQSDVNWAYPLFSEIFSFVISGIAHMGFKDRVSFLRTGFGLCCATSWSLLMLFCSNQYQYLGKIFHFPYMNQRKVVNHCYRLNGNLIFPHSKIFSALIMVCKLTTCDVESLTGMVSSCVLAGTSIYFVVPW